MMPRLTASTLPDPFDGIEHIAPRRSLRNAANSY